MRLFVAINFPEDLRQAIWQAAEPLHEASLPVRWVPADAVHLTLKFLGETPAERVPAIREILEHSARGTRTFTLPVGGFGAFPSVERPRVIWVGCEGVPALELLQNDLETGLERLGFPVEGRPFRPHVSLGRVAKDARPQSFRSLGSLLERLSFERECLVESVELMESRLGPGGSRYQTLQSAPLDQR